MNLRQLVTTLSIMGLFNLFGCSKKPDPDEAVLIQLRKAGSNLSKPHNIEFFLYFPTQSAAQQAASQIKLKEFNVEVGPGAQGNDWLCAVTKKMTPALPALQKIRIDFNDLSESLGGQYDGWGTEVEQ
jgi:Regulator of ribonuclease activity B